VAAGGAGIAGAGVAVGATIGTSVGAGVGIGSSSSSPAQAGVAITTVAKSATGRVIRERCFTGFLSQGDGGMT
jgi:hypothetical protein